jgi:hypothetical protein
MLTETGCIPARSISRMSHIETQPHGLEVRGKFA